MPYLLNAIYLILLVVASPWLAWSAWRTGKYRHGWMAKLLGIVPRRESAEPAVWLHAVSVGEVNVLAPLLRELAARHPDWECVISTTTRTGYAMARTKYATHTVFYCPLDFTWAVRRAMRRIRPRLLVLAELELWPNLIRAAREYGAQVAVVNGRLSDRSFRGYHCVRAWTRRLLRQIDLLAVQNKEYADRFLALGAPVESVHITGSLKYDGAQTDRHNAATQRLARLAGFSADDIVFLAGSTQDPEESIALAVYQSLAVEFPRLRLIIVPRHPERFTEVASLLDESGLPWQRRSTLDQTTRDPRARVLMVDAVGELGAWWGTARIAFVGGSLGRRGGQNMIEPAAYGAAVSFGPNTRNFRDIVAHLLAAGAAVVVHNERDLAAFVRRALVDKAFAAQLGANARALVARQLGATERTATLLEARMGEFGRAITVARAAA